MNKIFAFLLCLICVPAFALVDYVEIIDKDPLPDPENAALLQDETPKYVDDTGIDWHGFANGYYELDGGAKIRADGLNPGDWHAFNTETEVLGTSTCNSHDDNTSTLFASGDVSGKNCWCKIIAVTNDIHKTVPSKWIYRGQYNNGYECANLCAYRCSYNFLDDPDFRGEIFNK